MTKKFGSWLDEDENVWVGGTTICECLTYCLTCKSNPNNKRKTVQSTDETTEEIEEDGDFVHEDQAENANGNASQGNGGSNSKMMSSSGNMKGRNHQKTMMMREHKATCCEKMFCCGKGSGRKMVGVGVGVGGMSEMELSELNLEIENERLLSGGNNHGEKASPSDATMVDSSNNRGGNLAD